jgi:hypothetical protein
MSYRTHLRIGTTEGQTLLEAEDVQAIPREFEMIRVMGQSEDYVVVEEGVARVFFPDREEQRVTVVVISKKAFDEQQKALQEELVESKDPANLPPAMPVKRIPAK